jgi:hypothetical protein
VPPRLGVFRPASTDSRICCRYPATALLAQGTTEPDVDAVATARKSIESGKVPRDYQQGQAVQQHAAEGRTVLWSTSHPARRPALTGPATNHPARPIRRTVLTSIVWTLGGTKRQPVNYGQAGRLTGRSLTPSGLATSSSVASGGSNSSAPGHPLGERSAQCGARGVVAAHPVHPAAGRCRRGAQPDGRVGGAVRAQRAGRSEDHLGAAV